MNKLKIAVVGCGNISNTHFEVISKNENAELVAVCDNQKDRADKTAAKYSCKAFYDFDEMLQTADFDVLHICTPHYLHAPEAVAAMKKGKDVLSEKPMAMDYESALEIEKTVNETGRKYGVCFQNRYNPSSVKMREILDGGSLGKVIGSKGIVCWDRDENYYLADEWRGKIKTEGGGVLINQAIHTLDLLQWLTGGELQSVRSSISTKRLSDYIEVEDTADLLLDFGDGIRSVFFATICNACNNPVELDIYCENGKLSLGDKLIVKKGDTEEIIDVSKKGGAKGYWGNSHGILINEFYNSILQNTDFPIGASEAKKAIKILDEVYKNR